jgi:hypothetical protein
VETERRFCIIVPGIMAEVLTCFCIIVPGITEYGKTERRFCIMRAAYPFPAEVTVFQLEYHGGLYGEKSVKFKYP